MSINPNFIVDLFISLNFDFLNIFISTDNVFHDGNRWFNGELINFFQHYFVKLFHQNDGFADLREILIFLWEILFDVIPNPCQVVKVQVGYMLSKKLQGGGRLSR
jgi:hypothetical protein